MEIRTNSKSPSQVKVGELPNGALFELNHNVCIRAFYIDERSNYSIRLDTGQIEIIQPETLVTPLGGFATVTPIER